MATIILSTIGNVVAGPVGGAIGAIAGQAIDQNILFKPKGRQRPRLNDLSVQTSSYGSQLPRLFGTMRVAGTVAWASDLKETRMRSGGKGRPTVTSYSYSASFAVLLSARPIIRVGRIWADGNLLRGSDGDFKTATGFRLYRGDEDQPADPLIAAAEGAQAPAFRGLAYAMFEDLALADYGNRIPSLTFEVVADEGAVSVSRIIAELSAGALSGPGEAAMLTGYAASGDSVRGAIEPLSLLLPLSVVDDGSKLSIAGPESEALAIARDELAMRDGGGAVERSTGAVDEVPATLAIRHYEPARDYQAGVQQARRAGAGRRDEQLSFPAALPAAMARTAAEAVLARAWNARVRLTLRLGWTRPDIVPGKVVTVEGEPGRWRVARSSFERNGVTLNLVRQAAAVVPLVASDAGRGTAQPDLRHGATTLHLLDLPNLGDDLANGPRLIAVAAGVERGWRGAPLLLSRDGGASFEAIGRTAPATVMGSAETALAAGAAAIVDLRNQVVVRLLNDAMMLEDADSGRVAGGANLALLGNELIQFGHAEPMGEGRWRLSLLARGRRGTEWAAAGHRPGEPFVLIESDALLPVDLPAAMTGGEARLLATGIGDGIDGVMASATAIGEAVRPPAPAHLSIARMPDGAAVLRWVRRSRLGWAWIDGVDAPLGEQAERYEITVRPAGLIPRSAESARPEWRYDADAIAADRAAGAATAELSVVQLGTLARSREAVLTLAL